VSQDSYGGHGYQARFWDLMQYSRAAISCSAPGKRFEAKTIFLQRGTMFCREGMLLFVGRDATFCSERVFARGEGVLLATFGSDERQFFAVLL
jgi:hypothetical protein